MIITRNRFTGMAELSMQEITLTELSTLYKQEQEVISIQGMSAAHEWHNYVKNKRLAEALSNYCTDNARLQRSVDNLKMKLEEEADKYAAELIEMNKQ